MKPLSKRLAALETELSPPLRLPAAWVFVEPNQTDAEAKADYEAKHGAFADGLTIILCRTGVPRGEGALCA